MWSQPYEIDPEAPEGTLGQSLEGTLLVATCLGDWGQMPKRVSIESGGGQIQSPQVVAEDSVGTQPLALAQFSSKVASIFQSFEVGERNVEVLLCMALSDMATNF